MRRVIISIVLISLLILTFSCSKIDNVFSNSSSARAVILRQSSIGYDCQMYQLEVTLSPGGELPIILEMADGETADGYFYVEKGDDNIAFNIRANDDIYDSDFEDLPADTPVSDRFSFTATSDEGISYVMTLSNISESDDDAKSTIFFEIIYEGTSPIFTPLKTE